MKLFFLNCGSKLVYIIKKIIMLK